jgi:2-polyprenyl-3-methyl-5-hydroxy-6-metoxy-1,4-benzoquinol methylase
MTLAARLDADEMMDDPALAPAVYARVLADLARLNALTLASWPTLRFLSRGLRGRRVFRLLDVGFGQGDLLRAIGRWAARRGIEARLVGVDLNPNSAGAARAATPAGMDIDWRTGDWRDQPDRFDFIVSSLVAHHMTRPQLIDFLSGMEARAAAGWHVNDLWRSRLALAGFTLLVPLIGAHPIVRHDGQVSIRRAFRSADWRGLLEGAGLAGAPVRMRHYANMRLCLDRLK